MDSDTITLWINSQIDMDQLKTDELTQQDKQTTMPAANEIIFRPGQSITRKKE